MATSTPTRNPRRLLFHDHVASVKRNPQALAERLAQRYHLLGFAPRNGLESTFLHRTITAPCGGLVRSGGYTTPIQGRIGDRPHIGSVNFLVSGCVSYRSGDREIPLNPRQPLFSSPGFAYDAAVDGHFNGVAFQPELNHLRRTAAARAGLGVSPRRFCSDRERVRVLAPLASSGSRKVEDREQVFDELVEWTRAHRGTPISLSPLSFQARFGLRASDLLREGKRRI